MIKPVKPNLTIALTQIDGLWQDLPNDILHWNTELAEATRELMMVEQERNLLKAQVERKIRTNPIDYGYPKITEDGIKSTIVLQPEIVAIEQRFIEAKDNCNTLKAVVEALDVKRSSLKYLTELTLAGYIGSAAIPAGIKK